MSLPNISNQSIKEKELLVPAFLRVRGLYKTHIESFDYFINVELSNIIMAKVNNKVLCDVDPHFYLQYKKIRVGFPEMHDGEYLTTKKITPHECRIRDLTYAADICVDMEGFHRGKK